MQHFHSREYRHLRDRDQFHVSRVVFLDDYIKCNIILQAQPPVADIEAELTTSHGNVESYDDPFLNGPVHTPKLEFRDERNFPVGANAHGAS